MELYPIQKIVTGTNWVLEITETEEACKETLEEMSNGKGDEDDE